MAIPTVSAPVRSYLSSFDSVAVVLTSRGSIISTPNPTGYERAWWVRKADAARLVEESRERGNVEASAKRLGIAVTVHEIAIMRADKALARLDSILADAKRNGDLKAFNRAYKCHRQAAMAAGAAYMPYTTAERRLKRALMGVIAANYQGREFQFAIARVFNVPRE
jgi:hypothetical protein